MKLITFGPEGSIFVESVNVLSSKCGRRYDRIELEGVDMYQLGQLGAEAFQDWVRTWQLGFPPSGSQAADPRHEMNPTRSQRWLNGDW